MASGTYPHMTLAGTLPDGNSYQLLVEAGAVAIRLGRPTDLLVLTPELSSQLGAGLQYLSEHVKTAKP